MGAVTARVSVSTIREYIRKVEESRTQKYKMLTLLKKKGRITFNHSGIKFNWKAKVHRNEPVGMGDLQTMQYERINRLKEAELDYRAQSMNEAISKMEKLQNRGKPAIVKLEDMVGDMTEDFLCSLDKQVYIDGDATGNEDKLQGLLTIVATGSSADAYPVPTTSDSYGGLVMSRGYYGGTSTGTYPDSVDDPLYYFWTPFQVHYDHADFGASWEAGGAEAMRFGLEYFESSRGEDRPDTIFVTPKMLAQFKESQTSKEHIEVVRGQDSEMTKLGFKAVSWEGAEIVSDYHVPSGHGFGVKLDDIELLSMQDQLLDVGKSEHQEDRTDRFSLDFFGNLKLSPRSTLYFGAY